MEFDKSKYKVKTWKNFILLHYIINPGAGVGELWGQRLAKITLIDKTSEKPLMERTYVPCPHCETLHDGRTWSKKNGTALKNWFGLYCPNCGGIIPCLHNATAYLFLMITFPIWGWFKDWLKQKWLEKQPERYEEISVEEVRHESISWAKIGLKFGGFMYVFMSMFNIIQEPSHYIRILLISIPVWTLGGLGFGYVMKYWMGRKGEKAQNSSLESESAK